jgi:hypothetical protein
MSEQKSEKELTAQQAEAIAAGQRAFFQTQNEIFTLKNEIVSLKNQIHLLELDKLDLQKQLMRAMDDRDIALKDKDEAMVKSAAYATLHGMIQKTLNEFDPPKVINHVPKTTEQIGTEAVTKALEDKR